MRPRGRPRRESYRAPVQSVDGAAHDLATSNSTTHHFLGTAQRSWMTGPRPPPSARPSQPIKEVRANTGRSLEHSQASSLEEHSMYVRGSEVERESPGAQTQQQHDASLPAFTHGSQRGSSSARFSAHNTDNISLQTSENVVASVDSSKPDAPRLTAAPVPYESYTQEHRAHSSSVATPQISANPSLPVSYTTLSPTNSSPTAQPQWQSFFTSEPLRFSPDPFVLGRAAPIIESTSGPVQAPVPAMAPSNATVSAPDRYSTSTPTPATDSTQDLPSVSRANAFPTDPATDSTTATPRINSRVLEAGSDSLEASTSAEPSAKLVSRPITNPSRALPSTNRLRAAPLAKVLTSLSTATTAIAPNPLLASPVSVPDTIPNLRKRPGNAEDDLANKRPRPSIGHNQQIPTPTGTPEMAQVNAYAAQLRNTVDRVKQQITLTGTDESRLALLLAACAKEDIGFIILHQIYCLATFQPQSVTYLGFGRSEKGGLRALEPILLSNQNLSPLMITIFANFPGPPQSLYEPAMLPIVEKITEFLAVFAESWGRLRQYYLYRQFPPCCDELIFHLGLAPYILQDTLFSSIHRQIAGSTNSYLQLRAYKLFRATQANNKHYATLPGYMVGDYLSQVTLAFGQEYRNMLQELGIRVVQQNPTQAPTQPVNNALLPGSPGYVSQIPQSAYGSSSRLAGTPVPHLSPRAPPMTTVPGRPTISLQGMPSQLSPTTQGPARQSAYVSPTQMQHRRPSMPSSGPPSQGVAFQQVPHHQPSVPGRLPAEHVPAMQFGNTPQTSIHGASVSPYQQNLSLPTNAVQPQNAARPWHQVHADPQQSLQARSGVAPSTTGRVTHGQSRAEPIMFTNSEIGQSQAQYLQSTQGILPQTPTPLLPRAGFLMPQTTHPNPDRVALHQVHLRSPPFVKAEEGGILVAAGRLYTYVACFILAPERVDSASRCWEKHFDLADHILGRKVQWAATIPDSGIAGARVFKPDSLLFRLKCVARDSELPTPSEEEFAETPSSWPTCAFVSFNDCHDVEMRKRGLWSRDLPADLTDLVREGQNTLGVSYHEAPADNKRAFYFAVEVLRVGNDETIRALARSFPHDEALASIVSPLRDAQDDEISFVDPTISIDLIDPFMATMWKTPVRGRRCKHRDCFDLDSFLLSRPSRQQNGPTDPDRWNCPICKKDARPHTLLIDEFLRSVRAKLEAESKFDARAILVKQDGEWEVKMEQEGNGTGQTGRKSTRNNTPAQIPTHSGRVQQNSEDNKDVILLGGESVTAPWCGSIRGGQHH